MTAGLGIYDTMQYVLPPIATWCVGQAASMASLLLAAGRPGMRHSLPNSRIMVHQPSGQAQVSVICGLTRLTCIVRSRLTFEVYLPHFTGRL